MSWQDPNNSAQANQGNPAPGWYPDATGAMRWWDGSAWGQVAPAAQGAAAPNTSMGVLAHILGLFVGFIGPLVLFLVADKNDPFARDQAAEALNFQLTLMIGFVISFILMFVLVGFLLFPLLILLDWVLCIMAAIAANRGEWYRYPINIRMVTP